jgi:DNA polymerase III delta subunit
LQYLVQSGPEDLRTLRMLLEKLSLVSENEITLNDIRTWYSENRDVEVSSLIRAIALKETAKAELLCKELLYSGYEPLQCVWHLVRNFRGLLALKSGINDSRELLPFPLKRDLPSLAKSFETTDLKKSLQTLASLDVNLKGSRISPETLLLNTITNLSLRS